MAGERCKAGAYDVSQMTLVVSIVVGEAGSGVILNVSACGPSWIADTTANRAVVESLWNQGKREGEVLTLFRSQDPQGDAEGILDTVDLHHADWTSIEILGAMPTPALEKALARLAAGEVTATAERVVYTRS